MSAERANLPPKIAHLERLRAAGVASPAGVAVADADLERADATVRAAIDSLLEGGPVIVRSALDVEDGDDASAAGLGVSRGDCRSLAMVVAALAEIVAAARDPWVIGHVGRKPRVWALVQRQIARREVIVIAGDPTTAMVERFADADDPLGGAHDPSWAGPLDAVPEPRLRSTLHRLLEVCARELAAPRGLDLEVVIDRVGEPWLVQARPLTRALQPDIVAFRNAAPARGTLVLDAEHNPAPLSPAHASLVRWLAGDRGDAWVICGWLYAAAREPSVRVGVPTVVRAGLATLRERLIPEARARLEAITAIARAGETTPHNDASGRETTPHNDASGPAGETAPSCDASGRETTPRSDASGEAARAIPTPRADEAAAPTIDTAAQAHDFGGGERLVDALAQARDAARQAMDGYALLAPARAHARALLERGLPTPAQGIPLCLRERDQYLDVLPAIWDLASPALATTLPARDRGEAADPTAPRAVAALFGELDDHLFALGLSPLRRVYLAAGARLELGDDVFSWTIEELDEALAGRGPAPASHIAERRAQQEARAALTPPPMIHNGAPLPVSARGYLRGLGIGPSVAGRLTIRADLEALLADPPVAGEILAIPALTAQAAVVLDALGVRAVCSEHGGALSHAALMTRELGLSALIGCRGCTALPEGAAVELDTRAGRLRAAPANHLS